MSQETKLLYQEPGIDAAPNDVLISICIPTHHGRDWSLKEAIDSILPQITPGLRGKIQICVSDNASQDSTQDLMRDYVAQNTGTFVTNRNPESIDAMLNIMKSVEIATGRYCWFLGSDDAFEPHAVTRVLELLREYPGVSGITVNRTNYNKKMDRTVTPDNPLTLPADPEHLHVYKTAETILLNCSMMHNFMSAQIFRRDLWHEIVDNATQDELMFFWLYLHSFVIGTICKRHPYWVWCPDRLIKFRTGNEAFWETLTFEQYANNNMTGIKRQWTALLGDQSPEYKLLMTDFFAIHWNASRCHSWKAHPSHTGEDDAVLKKEFIDCFGFLPRFWMQAYPFLLIPHTVNKAPRALGLTKVLHAAKALKNRLKIRARIYRAMGRETPWLEAEADTPKPTLTLPPREEEDAPRPPILGESDSSKIRGEEVSSSLSEQTPIGQNRAR